MLHSGQLKLKVDGHVTLQGECPVACAPDRSGRKSHVTRKLGCAHDRVGMDGNQQILLIL